MLKKVIAMKDKTKKQNSLEKARRLPEGELIPAKDPERSQALFVMYRSVDGSHAERMKYLIEKTGYSKSLLYELSKRYDWPGELQRGIEESLEREAQVASQSVFSKGTEEVSFQDLAREIRYTCFMAIRTSREMVSVFSYMISYWSGRIMVLIDAKGGIENLSELDMTRLTFYQDKIMSCLNRVENLISPSSATKYLNIVNMKENLAISEGKGELEGLTPARMCEMMEKLGFTPEIGSKAYVDAVEKGIAEMGIELPDCDGRIIKPDPDKLPS